MSTYNHMFVIAFSLENSDPTGENTTAEELLAALAERLRDLRRDPEQIIEACGMPDDTYEVERDE